MIYFMQSVEGGPVKIGTTESLGMRHKQLERHYGRSLVILATMDGGYEEEGEIHARFSHLRLGDKEQFRPEPDLMEFIGKPLFASALDVAPMDSPLTAGLITIRCRPEYKKWLLAFAKSERDIPSRLIDLGLIELAKIRGYSSPPER
jgi:hypothetical protein